MADNILICIFVIVELAAFTGALWAMNSQNKKTDGHIRDLIKRASDTMVAVHPMMIETKDIAEQPMEPSSENVYEVWLPETYYKILKIHADTEKEAIERAELGDGYNIRREPFNSPHFEPKVKKLFLKKDAA